MSNNDLFCSKCRSHHHPVECPADADNKIWNEAVEACKKAIITFGELEHFSLVKYIANEIEKLKR